MRHKSDAMEKPLGEETETDARAYKVCEFWHHTPQLASRFLAEVHTGNIDDGSDVMFHYFSCLVFHGCKSRTRRQRERKKTRGARLDWLWIVHHLHFLFIFTCLLCFQSPFGTRRLSTRSRPTSTSPPCKPNSPPISPSISRPARLQECFWRTWASRTSLEWS